MEHQSPQDSDMPPTSQSVDASTNPSLDSFMPILSSGVADQRSADHALGLSDEQMDAQLLRQKRFDAVFREITRFSALAVLAVMILIIGALTSGSWLSIKTFGFHFL